MRRWWEDAVFYEVYPWSFADSNGDGIGDLAGIKGKLDYLAGLGVDALWIAPFFKSPMKDFGYDVADYRDIDPRFGTLEDLKALIADAKSRGIRIVLDLVANHSSVEHPWFAEARASRDSPKHGWYLWAPETGRPPNNWKAVFELGTAWHKNPATGERYLGTFTRHQAEFDWRNREVREEFYAIMRFWYGLGVDGFRLDVATAYLKDPELRSNPLSLNAIPDFFQRHLYDRNQSGVHEIFREMRKEADAAGGRVLIGETYGLDPALAASCHGERGDELDMAFNFEFLSRPWGAKPFRRAAEQWYEALPEGAWPNFTLSNHDQPRHIWRYRAGGHAEERARVAAAMLLTIRGTPFLYYGEEIGMTCEKIPREAMRDPLGIAAWPIRALGRDPERTPMQWDSGPNAGFSSGKPWLPLNSDCRTRNVAAQEGEPESLLNWYKALIALRRSVPALREGSIAFLDLGRDVLAYERATPSGERVLVALNFAAGRRTALMPNAARVLLGSARESGSSLLPGRIELGPLEAIVAEADNCSPGSPSPAGRL
jgi:alpha-glucosidase